MFSTTANRLYTGQVKIFGSKKGSDAFDLVEKCLRQLADARRDIEALQSSHRNLQTEWVNAHDKLLKMANRIDKRAARAASNGADGEIAEPVAPGPYDHLDPISRKIQERRHGSKFDGVLPRR